MIPILASTYDWRWYLIVDGWPALNWLGALAIMLVGFRRHSSARWLLSAIVPVASAVWIALNFLRDEGGGVETYHLLGFFLPGLIGLAASVVVAWRVFRKPKHPLADVTWVSRLLARICTVMGRIGRMFGFDGFSERCARRAVAAVPTSAQGWRLLGLNLADRAQTAPPDEALEQQALDAFQRAYRYAPHDYYMAYGLVCYFGYLARLLQAEEVVREFAEKSPSNGKRLETVLRGYQGGSTRGMSKQERDDCECGS